jgi:NADPH:quinone reductase
LPEDVSIISVTMLPVARTTALRTLRLGGDSSGQRIIITRASGAVGRFQIQFARQQGASVTAVAPARHVEDLRGLGAEQTVESIELAEGPFSLITESVGGESLAYAIERVASGGTVVMFGSSGGELTPIGFRQSGSRGRAASDRVLCLSSENWRGYHLATRAGRGRPARNARSPDRIVAGAQALDALRQRSISGKAVLTMAE